MLFLLALTACRETLVPGVSAPERDAQRAWGRALKRAVTDDGYVEEMTRRGYRHEADDDRGFTFRRSR